MKPNHYGSCIHAEPSTLTEAANQYLGHVRRIAKKMSVRDLQDRTVRAGKMTNLTIVRAILDEVVAEKKKSTVWTSRFNNNSDRIQVRPADGSTWDANESHPAYPYDGIASMKAAVEEVAGYAVARVGEAGGEILWLAAAE